LAVFTALVLALFLLILANRDLAHAALANLRGDNPWLARMFVGVALVLASVMLIPGLRTVMGFASVGLPPLAAALSLFALCGLWLQGLRLARGWRLA
ncbi:MAG: cation transporting ATPase C-terminal domain-containing protein, partial [Metallibacterium scheffleri]